MLQHRGFGCGDRLRPTAAGVSVRERVIVGDVNGLVRAFDTATGEILWRVDLGERLRSAPAFHKAWGIVVFALASGRVHALDVDSGGEAWKQELKEKILAPPTITIDGRVIVGTRAGGLYALDGEWRRYPLGAPLATPDPRPHHLTPR